MGLVECYLAVKKQQNTIKSYWNKAHYNELQKGFCNSFNGKQLMISVIGPLTLEFVLSAGCKGDEMCFIINKPST